MKRCRRSATIRIRRLPPHAMRIQSALFDPRDETHVRAFARCGAPDHAARGGSAKRHTPAAAAVPPAANAYQRTAQAFDIRRHEASTADDGAPACAQSVCVHAQQYATCGALPRHARPASIMPPDARRRLCCRCDSPRLLPLSSPPSVCRDHHARIASSPSAIYQSATTVI